MNESQKEVQRAKSALMACRISFAMAQDDLTKALVRQATTVVGPRSVHTTEQLQNSVDHWRKAVAQWATHVEQRETDYKNALMSAIPDEW